MRVIVYPHAMEIGGSQLNAIELAAAVRDRGHTMLVVSEYGPLLDTVRRLGLDHLEIPAARRRPSPAVSRRLVHIVAERGIDIVHGYEWPPAVEAFLGPRLQAGVPAVATVLSMAVAPFLPRQMPLLVGTEEIRRRALAAGHTHVTLLEPPVDIQANSPEIDGNGFRAEHGLDPATPLIVLVSRLARELKLEGLLSACDAVGTLTADGIDVQLVIVGDGPARDLVTQRAARVNASAGRRVVVLTGMLSDPRPAYAGADIMLGMGGSALRGLAFGKPLIVQGEQGFWRLLTRETVAQFLDAGWFGIGDGNGVEGVARLRSELEPLLTDVGLRRRLGEYGRQLVVERFSLEHAAEVQEKTYEAALAAPAKGVTCEAARTTALVGLHVARRKLERLRGSVVATDDFNLVTPAPVDRRRDLRLSRAARRDAPTLR